MDNGKPSYMGSLDCYWNITAPKGKTVTLRFTSFDLEHNYNCRYDFVEIFEGLSANKSSRLALLCGDLQNHLSPISSLDNTMLVHMKTDFSRHNPGFKAAVAFMYGK